VAHAKAVLPPGHADACMANDLCYDRAGCRLTPAWALTLPPTIRVFMTQSRWGFWVGLWVPALKKFTVFQAVRRRDYHS
jgi:hypothetical protein